MTLEVLKPLFDKKQRKNRLYVRVKNVACVASAVWRVLEHLQSTPPSPEVFIPSTLSRRREEQKERIHGQLAGGSTTIDQDV
ncbi:hypothetical protein ATANTOWER_007043 [Ataeniobius toweri]|uniref:Uncharacterized protein n=1 Tax=Ataeniobius toweri TaxID=208326 RepID=A0ABU7BR77_9TELE|nr:hypothetical protein [Ataeniobius toweri]